jgi:hypothetical protein
MRTLNFVTTYLRFLSFQTKYQQESKERCQRSQVKSCITDKHKYGEIEAIGRNKKGNH